MIAIVISPIMGNYKSNWLQRRSSSNRYQLISKRLGAESK